jgi:hypothetical protein
MQRLKIHVRMDLHQDSGFFQQECVCAIWQRPGTWCNATRERPRGYYGTAGPIYCFHAHDACPLCPGVAPGCYASRSHSRRLSPRLCADGHRSGPGTPSWSAGNGAYGKPGGSNRPTWSPSGAGPPSLTGGWGASSGRPQHAAPVVRVLPVRGIGAAAAARCDGSAGESGMRVHSVDRDLLISMAAEGREWAVLEGAMSGGGGVGGGVEAGGSGGGSLNQTLRQRGGAPAQGSGVSSPSSTPASTAARTLFVDDGDAAGPPELSGQQQQ